MMRYVGLFSLTVIDCILNTVKTKAMIYGHDRIANLLKSICRVMNATIITLVATDLNIESVAILGVGTFVGSEIGSYYSNRKWNKRKEKTRKYKVRVDSQNEYQIKILYAELTDKNIEVYAKENKIAITSYSKQESKIIKDTIEETMQCEHSIEIIPIIKKIIKEN